MISLSKSGSTVTFTFDENSGYLQNGTIDVPVNSLSLILDESNMATFRKSASNDIFVSANIAEFGMSKSELEAWYKANMVGSSGGGSGSGITSGEVQSMIDESISGKADSSSLATVATSGNYNDLTNKPTIPTVSSAITSGDTNAVQGGAVYDQLTIGGGSGMVEITAVTAGSWVGVSMPDCDKFTISAATAIGNQLTQGGSVIKVYDKSTDTLVLSFTSVTDINSDYVTVEGTTADTSIALTAVDGYYFKGSDSMFFKSNYSTGWVVTFYRLAEVMSWLKDAVSANTAAIEGKQDTLSAGNGISIDTANTISLGVAISASTGANSIKENNAMWALGENSHAEGIATRANGQASHAEGWDTIANGVSSHAEGCATKTYNESEHASGQFNYSVSASTNFGDSGNTLFSVGNGTSIGTRHNAFEIRQNGDIYITSGGTDIKLQDNLGGGGGGGATYTAGRGIDITNDTISFSLPISAGTGTNSIKQGDRTSANGNYSHAEGYITSANGSHSHAEGGRTKASGDYSHAEGNWTSAVTASSHAEGNSTLASGQNSHAEGEETYANGQSSHAEGYGTYASGYSSHAEGYGTYALGSRSHAEGNETVARGDYSHAEGNHTETKNAYEHASGRYNVSRTGNTDADRTLFTVGNGTGAGENASNAFEIRQNDDIYIIKDNEYKKLQDYIGIDASSAITSGDTNAVAGGAVYSKFDEVEQVTAAALNNLNDKFGGLKLEQITQADYDALSGDTDSNTLYVIVN